MGVDWLVLFGCVSFGFVCVSPILLNDAVHFRGVFVRVLELLSEAGKLYLRQVLRKLSQSLGGRPLPHYFNLKTLLIKLFQPYV